MLRSQALQKWWPTTQSLDLVEGSTAQVAAAIEQEVCRFLKDEPLHAAWENHPTLDSAFQAVPDFHNVPTIFLVLPTHSRWSVLWNNSFLCSGYDSLCAMLTRNHGLTTLHWTAHDDVTTFQPAASFTHRRLEEGQVQERSVVAGQQDNRWRFEQAGQALPEEDLDSYQERSKRHRLNEAQMSAFLSRLSARPWQADFYAVDTQLTFVLKRKEVPPSITRRAVAEVVTGSESKTWVGK